MQPTLYATKFYPLVSYWIYISHQYATESFYLRQLFQQVAALQLALFETLTWKILLNLCR